MILLVTLDRLLFEVMARKDMVRMRSWMASI